MQTARLELNRCVLELTVLSSPPLLPLLQSLKRPLFHRLLLPVLARDVVPPVVLVDHAPKYQLLLCHRPLSEADVSALTALLDHLRLAVSVPIVLLFPYQLLLALEVETLLLLQQLPALVKDAVPPVVLVNHAPRFQSLLLPLAFSKEAVLELIVLLELLKLAVSALIAQLFPLPKHPALEAETPLLLQLLQLLLALVRDVDLLDALVNHALKFQLLLCHRLLSEVDVLEVTVPLDPLRLAARVLIAPLFPLPRHQTIQAPVLPPMFAWEKIVALLDALDRPALLSASNMSSP